MARHELVEAQLTHSVIGAFYKVYNSLGFGFFESIYMNALELELRARGHHVAREVSFEITYKGHVLGSQRIDMIVDQKLVVETKSTQELHRAALRQVSSYLSGTRLRVGLLLHFGPEPRFYRFINYKALDPSDSVDRCDPKLSSRLTSPSQ